MESSQNAAEGLTPDTSVRYALERIATGHAVPEAYEEFVQKDGAGDSLYCKYVVGDVVCEHMLLQALQRPTPPTPASPLV